MDLTNFDSHLDPTILARGKDYFTCGHISSLEYEDDCWVAEVEGSETYTVEVELSDNGEIIGSCCDCPYDWGEYCKHQAAVFYALREMKPSRMRKGPHKPKLSEQLEKLDKKVLIKILLEYAENDRSIKSDLRLRLSQP